MHINYAEKPRERNSGEIFFADMGEKSGEKMATFFAIFRPSISRESGRKKFHEKLATNLARRDIPFFHRKPLGVWGHNINGGSSASYLYLAPLASSSFALCLRGVKTEGFLDYQGRAGIISIVWWNLCRVIVGVDMNR